MSAIPAVILGVSGGILVAHAGLAETDSAYRDPGITGAAASIEQLAGDGGDGGDTEASAFDSPSVLNQAFAVGGRGGVGGLSFPGLGSAGDGGQGGPGGDARGRLDVFVLGDVAATVNLVAGSGSSPGGQSASAAVESLSIAASGVLDLDLTLENGNASRSFEGGGRAETVFSEIGTALNAPGGIRGTHRLHAGHGAWQGASAYSAQVLQKDAAFLHAVTEAYSGRTFRSRRQTGRVRNGTAEAANSLINVSGSVRGQARAVGASGAYGDPAHVASRTLEAIDGGGARSGTLAIALGPGQSVDVGDASLDPGISGAIGGDGQGWNADHGGAASGGGAFDWASGSAENGGRVTVYSSARGGASASARPGDRAGTGHGGNASASASARNENGWEPVHAESLAVGGAILGDDLGSPLLAPEAPTRGGGAMSDARSDGRGLTTAIARAVGGASRFSLRAAPADATATSVSRTAAIASASASKARESIATAISRLNFDDSAPRSGPIRSLEIEMVSSTEGTRARAFSQAYQSSDQPVAESDLLGPNRVFAGVNSEIGAALRDGDELARLSVLMGAPSDFFSSGIGGVYEAMSTLSIELDPSQLGDGQRYAIDFSFTGIWPIGFGAEPPVILFGVAPEGASRTLDEGLTLLDEIVLNRRGQIPLQITVENRGPSAAALSRSSFSFKLLVVPEPSGLLLTGLGLAVLSRGRGR